MGERKISIEFTMITLRIYGLIFGIALVVVIVVLITLSTETCVRLPPTLEKNGMWFSSTAWA